MDRQLIFDQVVHQLTHQNGRSLHERHNVCLYFGPDGKRCAIGAVLPDSYAKILDGWMGAVDELLTSYPQLYDDIGIEIRKPIKEINEADGPYTLAVDESDIEFLMDLQKMHDDGNSWFNGMIKPDALKYLAHKYKLLFEGEIPEVRPIMY